MYLAPWEERRRVLVGIVLGMICINVAANMDWGDEMTGDYACDSIGWKKRDKALKVWSVVVHVKEGDDALLLARHKEVQGVVQGTVAVAGNLEGLDFEKYNVTKLVANTSSEYPGEDEDLVMITHVNEIPSGEAVKIVQQCTPATSLVTFEMQSFLYDFGCKERRRRALHAGYIMQRDKLIKRCDGSPLEACYQSLGTGKKGPGPVVISNAGWRVALYNDNSVKVPEVIRGTDVETCFYAKCLHPNMKTFGDKVPESRLRMTGPRTVRTAAFNAANPAHSTLRPLFGHRRDEKATSCQKIAAKIRDAHSNPRPSPFSVSFSKKSEATERDLREAVAMLNKIDPPPRKVNLTSIALAIFFLLAVVYIVLARHCRPRRR
eukprot:TRINITY_DN747_c0_g1_i10.p1 TRINITY_DN747_c0_g1~~TRINITY_DN747_c0_g1_i10.p1  ORF type:complete len:377 (+),score=121.68 TRINITY_DN747_c0_g1_i10:793-1923(+)